MNENGPLLRTITGSDGGKRLVSELFSGDLGSQFGSLLVMPTERGCFHAKIHLLEQGGGISGSILTPRRLAEKLYDLLEFEEPVLDLSGREIIIRELLSEGGYSRLSGKGPVRLGMASYLSHEIGDLIMSGIDPEVLLDKGGRKSDLGRLFINYLSYLDRKGLTDPEQIPWKVIEGISSHETPWRSMRCHLLGSLPNSYDRLVKTLIDIIDETVIEEHSSRTDEAIETVFNIPRRDQRGRQTVRSDHKVVVLKAGTMWDEVDQVARVVKDLVLKEDIDPASITVIFPSRRDYDPIVKLVFGRYGIPISLGNDLRGDRIPAISSLIRLLRTPIDGYPREQILDPLAYGYISIPFDGEIESDWLDLERFTRERFIIGGGKEPMQDWVDGLLSISTDPLRSERTSDSARMWSEMISLLLGDLDRIASGKMDIPRRCQLISGFLERYSFSKEDNGWGRDYDILLVALRAVRKRAVILRSGPCDHSGFMALLLQELEKVKVTTSSKGQGVSMIGLEGSVGSDLDICIFSGCTSSMLPSGKGSFRILSERERMDLSMQKIGSRRKELEELAIALNSANRIFISYHRDRGGKPTEISPMIENLDMEIIEPPSGLLSPCDVIRRVGELNDPSFHLYDRGEVSENPVLYDQEAMLSLFDKDLSENIRRGLLGKSNRLASGPNPYRGYLMEDALTESMRIKFGPEHIWSPSRLESYRQCPYQFFSRYVLGIREREDLEPGVPPEKKGSIFHSIAERFYVEMMKTGRTKVKAADLDRSWKLISTIAEDELSKYNYSGPYWEALRDLLLGRDGEEGLLMEFLRVEASYTGLFEVMGTEVKFGPLKGKGEEGVRISAPGDEGIDIFLLQGSIDRMDRYGTRGKELLYIWDYKTGSKDIPEDSLQVPLYLASLGRIYPDSRPGGGGFYYIRKKGSIHRAPVHGPRIWEETTGKDAQKDSEKVREMISKAVETSFNIIDSIRSGNFAPEPSCWSRYCPYINICRRREN